MTRKIIFLCTIILALSYNVLADEIKLTWDMNTEVDLAGYRLYRYIGTPDETEGVYEKGEFYKEIEALAEPTYTDKDLADGNYFYRVSAYDEYDNESGLSNEVYEIIDKEAPDPPKNLKSFIQKIISFLRKLLPWNKSLKAV